MFYTIQRRDQSGIRYYRTDADVSGWTVNATRAVLIHSPAAAFTLGAHISTDESDAVTVVEHDGTHLINNAQHSVLATFRNGRKLN